MFKKIFAFLMFIVILFSGFVLYRTIKITDAVEVNNIPNESAKILVSSVGNLSNALKHKVVTTTDIESNDYKAHDAFWEFLKTTYPDVFANLKTEKINNYNYLLKWEGKNDNFAPIMMTAHYDTVDVDEKTVSKWKHEPFGGEVEDNKIWGRGALDDRASFIAIFEAINALLKESYIPDRDIYFAFGHDEETGGFNGAVKIAQYLKDQNIKFDMILDEGGRVEIDSKSNQTALIGIGEKGRYLVNINIENLPSHASVPRSETSITQLAKVVDVLNKNQMEAQITPQALQYLKDNVKKRGLLTRMLVANNDIFKSLLILKLSKNNVDNALIRTTTAFTKLQGSKSANAVPQIAQLMIDFRIISTQTPNDVKEHIENVLNKELKGVKYTLEEVSSQMPTKVSNINNMYFKFLKKEISTMFPSADIVPYIINAGTDARNYDGLSDNVYRFLPIVLTRDEHALMHGIDEHISIENYCRMIEFYKRFLKNNFNAF